MLCGQTYRKAAPEGQAQTSTMDCAIFGFSVGQYKTHGLDIKVTYVRWAGP